MPTFIAKAVNCSTGRSVLLNEGEVALSGWTVNGTFQLPDAQLPYEMADEYLEKALQNITLNIQITCATPELARTKSEEILAVFASKAKIYLFDDRYTYVIPRTYTGKFPDMETRWVDLTLQGQALPYFYSDKTVSYLFPPSDYPRRIESENPDPRANLQLYHYPNYDTNNIVTGRTELHSWSMSTAVAGYSGSGYITTSTPGNGISFSILGGFAVRCYETSSTRKLKVFIDGIYDSEVTYGGFPGWREIYSKKFSDSIPHSIVLVLSAGGCALDYIDSYASTLPAVSMDGQAEVYPYLDLVPVESIVRFTASGKILGDNSFPFTLKWAYSTNPLNLLPTAANWTETSLQSNYDKIGYYNNQLYALSCPNTGQYAAVLLIYNYKAAKAKFPGTWSAADIINAITRFYAVAVTSGSGWDGVSASIKNGVDLHIFRSSDSTWRTPLSNTLATPAKLTYPVEQYQSSYVNADGYVYIMLKAQYPAKDASVPSIVSLDYPCLETYYRRCDLSNVLTNRAMNLLPPFTSGEWAIHTNARVISEEELQLDATASAQNSAVSIPATPNTTYSFALESTGYILVIVRDKSDAEITRPYNYSAVTSGTFTTPANTASIRFYVSNSNDLRTFHFRKPILVRSDTVKPYVCQQKYSLSLTPTQSSSSAHIVIDPQNDDVTLGGMSLLPYVNSEFISSGLKLAAGINHLQFSHVGSMLQAILKYTEKFGTP